MMALAITTTMAIAVACRGRLRCNARRTLDSDFYDGNDKREHEIADDKDETGRHTLHDYCCKTPDSGIDNDVDKEKHHR